MILVLTVMKPVSSQVAGSWILCRCSLGELLGGISQFVIELVLLCSSYVYDAFFVMESVFRMHAVRVSYASKLVSSSPNSVFGSAVLGQVLL